MSQEYAELCKALAQAQSEFKHPIKNRTVDFTANGRRVQYSYADLADCLDSNREVLAKNGLSVNHRVHVVGDNHFYLNTSLKHSSGASEESNYPLPDPRSMKAQDFGGHLTYARRYSFSMIIGIASEEDTDGPQANESTKPKSNAKREANSPLQSYQNSKAAQTSKLAELGEYKLTFGPYKGKPIKSIPLNVLSDTYKRACEVVEGPTDAEGYAIALEVHAKLGEYFTLEDANGER